MPQIVHPTVIQGNRYYGGLFGAGGLGQQFLSPLFGAAAHALPGMLGVESPAEEAQRFQLDEAKRGQAKRIYADFMGGRLSQEEAKQGLDKYGYSLEDKAALQPSVEDEVRNQYAIKTAQSAGYDPTTHQYGGMGFQQGTQGDVKEEVPDFTTTKKVAASAPVKTPVEVKANVGPVNQSQDVMGEMARATENVAKKTDFQPFPEPLGGDSNPVKTRPASSFNFNELQQQGPQYFQQFFQPDDGQSFNYKGLSRSQQQQAQVISNRLLGFSNAMKMYDSKQVSAPEDVARTNAMIRTAEKDINQMVDWHNATTTGDINKIKAMGGLPVLAMDMRSLQMLTPAYIATLPANARGAVEQRARQIAGKLQNLNPFELKMVTQFSSGLGDESTKMLLNYQQEMARTGALNNQTQLGYYKTNVEDAQEKRELYQFKIPNMQLDAQTNFLKIHNDKIKNDIDAAKLGTEAQQIQLGYQRIAADLGIANNKNAVDYASMEVALRNQQSQARVAMTGQVMTALSAEQKRNMDMMIKMHSGLSGSKGIRDRVAAATALTTSEDPQVRQEAEETLRNISQNGTADASSLIAQKGIDFVSVLKGLGVPLPVGINPTESAGRQAQMGVAEMVSRASDLVDVYLKNGQTPPVELLNMRDHLKIDQTGSPMLDKNAYKTEEDRQLTGAGMVVPRDQKLVQLMQMQAQSFNHVPSFQEWMNWSVGNGIKNSNIPEFQDQSKAKQYYNQMVDFHGRMNGQRK